jgi:hypothetical protein
MTPRIRSFFPAPWTVAGVALLALASGCSEGSSQNGTLTPVLDQRGLITYRYITAEPAVPAPARADRPRQRMPYEAEIRQRQLAADQAYEAYREPVRQREQLDAQNLLQPQYPRADHNTLDRINGILAGANRDLEAAQQRIQIQQEQQTAGALRLQQSSQELDRALEQMRVQQAFNLQQSQLRQFQAERWR